jgi:hypothetical protein
MPRVRAVHSGRHARPLIAVIDPTRGDGAPGPGVRFRVPAYQRNKSLSAVANDLLDKALPKWSVERAE